MTQPLHILILADGRSPTTQSWVRNLILLDFKVSLISTFYCEPLPDLENFHVLPIAFSQYAGDFSSQRQDQKSEHGIKFILKRRFMPKSETLQTIRYDLGPLDVQFKARIFKRLVKKIQPDLVHALRIPFEGMLARFTPGNLPLIVSTWGNDFTLHAPSSWLMRHGTRACLKRANGLTADANRDIRLAHAWGLPESIPTLIIPGSGGVDLQAIQASKSEPFNPAAHDLPSDNKLWVVNARGFRPGYVHNDIFFASIPLVIRAHPEVMFICPGLEGFIDPAWLEDPSAKENVVVLPKLPQNQLWALFHRCPIFISPSSHDGTPNSLLEAMACGCFPIAGDIDSIREWIEPGINGLLVNPQDPAALSDAIILAIESPSLRQAASVHNLDLIKQRAELQVNQVSLKQFYENLAGQKQMSL